VIQTHGHPSLSGAREERLTGKRGDFGGVTIIIVSCRCWFIHSLVVCLFACFCMLMVFTMYLSIFICCFFFINKFTSRRLSSSSAARPPAPGGIGYSGQPFKNVIV